MTSYQPVFRFAPSPNGALHLGHAYSALVNFDAATAANGRFLIRVEDIDRARCTASLERAMFDDLAWLELEWETPVRRQSEHFSDYRQALDLLEEEGLTYRSQLSRGDVRRIVEAEEAKGEVWPRDPDGAPLFPGRAYEPETTDEDATFAVRLDMKAAIERVGSALSWEEGDPANVQQADPTKWGDVVLARRDTPTSYHLSVVVDDALQGVTNVVRGTDLFDATAVHVLLQKLLGFDHPHYVHHPLILGDDGRKLSKSNKDTSLSSLREAGLQLSDVKRMIGLN